MKGGKIKATALCAMFLAAVMAASLTGCSFNITFNENSTTSTVSAEEDSTDTEVSEKESSPESKEEPSEEQSSEKEEEPESSEESREEEHSMTESEAAEVVIDGYQFDDEQIVTDYHTAQEFTKNEEFNKIFKDNVIDTEYTDNLREAMTQKEMREATINCAKMWEEEVGVIYGLLCDMLKDKPEELKKLQDSQKEWESSVSTVESSFSAEASGNGSEAMLAADTAMMNYFKGRAAVLLEQIYELNGNQILLIEYGL